MNLRNIIMVLYNLRMVRHLLLAASIFLWSLLFEPLDIHQREQTMDYFRQIRLLLHDTGQVFVSLWRLISYAWMRIADNAFHQALKLTLGDRRMSFCTRHATPCAMGRGVPAFYITLATCNVRSGSHATGDDTHLTFGSGCSSFSSDVQLPTTSTVLALPRKAT